ncbi:MAG: hypothetical protein Q8K78_03175 [Planctomycetaceae bacterium]|nr:hypothetical protein [Planctomycetaceae bacterium]
MMSLLVPPPSSASQQASPLEYLLLGDLRLLLEEPASPETSRWIVAILDRLLAGRPRTMSPYLPSLPRGFAWETEPNLCPPLQALLFAKLQRLRDRVAHHAPYALLANEIRCDLREWMDA